MRRKVSFWLMLRDIFEKKNLKDEWWETKDKLREKLYEVIDDSRWILENVKSMCNEWNKEFYLSSNKLI